MRSLLAFFIALLFASITLVEGKKVTNPKRVPKNAILLSNVESLTLRAGRKTSSRRVSAVPQLTCLGPASTCQLYTIDTMRCKNEGSEYDKENIQWSCKASLPEEFKLGSTEVICEGYESSDDPYVLKGSCGVEYRLLLTDKGEEKYGTQSGSWGDYWWDDPHTGPSSSRLSKVLFFSIFGAVLFIIIRGFLQARRRQGPQPPQRRPGGGGGGGGNDDPPPPYDSHSFGPSPPRRPKTQSSSSQSSTSQGAGNRQQAQEAWRPGFWTGALGGAAAGYFASSRSNERQRQRDEAMGQFGGGAGGGGMFGGPGGTRRYGGGGGGGWGGGSSSSSSSSPSFSSSRHESTGFGGTSRR